MLVAFKIQDNNDSCIALHEISYIDSEIVYIDHRVFFRVWLEDLDGDLYYCDSLSESDIITQMQLYKSKGIIDFHYSTFILQEDD